MDHGMSIQEAKVMFILHASNGENGKGEGGENEAVPQTKEPN